MTKFLAVAALLSLLAFAPPAAANHGGKHIFTTVHGMVCDVCAQSLKKVFMKNSAVNNVHIDLTAKLVTLDLNNSQSIADTDIEKGIDYAGYKIVSINRD